MFEHPEEYEDVDPYQEMMIVQIVFLKKKDPKWVIFMMAIQILTLILFLATHLIYI